MHGFNSCLRANETKSKKKPYIKDEILHGRSPRKRLRALDKGRRERTDGFRRRTNYNLQIINTLIQNGKKELFERIPQEVLRGMSEGRRRNVEASLVVRGNESPVRHGTGGLPSVTDRGEEIENIFLRRGRQADTQDELQRLPQHPKPRILPKSESMDRFLPALQRIRHFEKNSERCIFTL